MHKFNSANILAFASVPGLVLIKLPALAKRTLAVLLMVSVTGCGSGDSNTGDTTPTNPQPSQPSMYADPSASNVLGAELGGAILAPGIYTSAQSLEISTGDVILDAQGNTNAVWVFEIGMDLHVATGRRVILSAGAQAANVYWQVGGSATLGEYSVFKGDIFAYDSITLLTGVHWEGQAWEHQGMENRTARVSTGPSP